HAVYQRTKRARGHFARSFVHRDYAAGMERCIAFRIVGCEDFMLGMHDQQVARVTVEFHFAVERDARAGQEAIDEIPSMKPFGQQALFRRILEDGFEEPEITPSESAEVG